MLDFFLRDDWFTKIMFDTTDDSFRSPCDDFQYNTLLSHLLLVGVSWSITLRKKKNPKIWDMRNWAWAPAIAVSEASLCATITLPGLIGFFPRISHLQCWPHNNLMPKVNSIRLRRLMRLAFHVCSVLNSSFRYLWLLIRVKDRLER